MHYGGGRGAQISQLCRAVLTDFSKLWKGLFSHALFKRILAMIVIIIGKNNGFSFFTDNTYTTKSLL